MTPTALSRSTTIHPPSSTATDYRSADIIAKSDYRKAVVGHASSISTMSPRIGGVCDLQLVKPLVDKLRALSVALKFGFNEEERLLSRITEATREGYRSQIAA